MRPDATPPTVDPQVATAVMAAAVDAILTIDRRGRIRSFNPAAERMFGWTADEVRGRNVSLLMPSDVAHAHDAYLDRHIATGHTAIIGRGREVRGHRRDGSPIELYLSVARFDLDGEPHFVGLLRDITADVERRRETEALAAELSRYSSLSEARLEVEVLARTADSAEELSHSLLTAIVRRVGACVGVLYLSDGELRPAASFGTPRPNDPSAMVRSACGCRSSQHAEGSPEGLTVETSFGPVIPRSVVAVPLFHHDVLLGALELGLTGDDAAMRSLLDALAPTLAGVVAHQLDQYRIRELLRQTSQQAQKLRRLNATLDERAALLAEQQRALEESHTELQLQTDALEEQKAELLGTNRELERARHLAEQRASELGAANRYKSQFLANMSHELRTPLNSILILARLLAEDGGERLDEDQLSSARAIGSAGSDLLALINDILDISRIEVGELRISPVRFDLRRSVEGLEQMFRPVAADRGLSFEVDLDPELPRRVVADETRLQQILRNLLANAIKFTERGGVRLTVRPDPTSHRVRFEVADTGIGIPEEAREQIFLAFQQADGSLTRKHNGAGLGLAISSRLAERMDGTLVLAQSSSAGSTFVLDVPVGRPDPTPTPQRRERAPSPPPSVGTGELVIVEDDSILGPALANLARSAGHSARCFGRGEEALSWCERHPPACVLVDLRLPDMPGEELVARLAASPATRHVPVHVMSGVTSGDRALQNGAISFLSKPFEADRFVAWLGESLRTVQGSVLLLETDPTEAAAITKLLGRHAITCVQAHDVESAERACAGRDVRCIILSLDAGGTAGLHFLDRRAADPALAAIPVIVSTSREISPAERGELEQHARSILVKREPLADRLVEETTRLVGRAAVAPDAAVRFAGRRVLVVDDDVRNVFALRQLLRGRDLEVAFAGDGAEALERVEQEGPFDAILMDVMMPVMDGLEATRRLRQRPGGDEIWICALTAKAMPGDRERCLEAGADAYLAKPVDNDELLGLLAERFAGTPVGGGG